ncbi:MAG: hypothetical protein SGILL_006051, partial [Bacillariaceae sp.]
WYPQTTTTPEHATMTINSTFTSTSLTEERILNTMEQDVTYHNHHRRRLDEMVVIQVDTVSETDQLSVDVTFEDILKTVVFLLVTFLAANLCKFISLPGFVGEIIAGVVLGPPVLDFCPYPEAMVLIGSFGLIGLILSGGIDLDIAQLRETGTRSVMIAVSGTVLALGSGIGVSYLDGTDSMQSAFSIGAAFAPSSWGVASQVLSKGEVLNTPIGQTILASSVADDILGLVLLSLLEVFVMDNPSTFDYIKPFLASFGYLIVLGFVGITIIPRVLSNYILPKFPEQQRDGVAIGLMFILMTVYLPLMNYSGASYLTGAFLAGVSFSQLHHVHATFAKSSHEVMIWLLRIFFAATIGFQLRMRGDKFAIYARSLTSTLLDQCHAVIPVASKFLLGFLTPWFKRDLPDDFPYNPYWRDFLITSFSMMCRGEFNFVVAAVALRAKLLSPEQYAAIVFAVLVSCIVCPLVLARIIAYYNKKSREYLDQSHPIKRIGNTCDGYRPLYLAIQARTPVNWGFHEKLEKTLESAGLIVIDHRSWHTLGYEDGVDITEIFCQDKQVQVKIPGYFLHEPNTLSRPSVRRSAFGKKTESEERISELPDESEKSDAGTFSVSSDVEALIDERKAEIKEMISKMLGSNLDSFAIQVSEWETFSFQRDPEQPDVGAQGESRGYCFFATQKGGADLPDDVGLLDNEVGLLDDGHDSIEVTPVIPKPTHHKRGSSLSLTRKVLNRAMSNASAVESSGDLWDTDAECHTVARDGFYQAPPGIDGSMKSFVAEGCFDSLPPRPRDESYKSVPRSRAESGTSSLEFLDVELPASTDQHQEEEVAETPLPEAQLRRRNHHQRSHTMEVVSPVQQSEPHNHHQRNNTMEISPPVEQTRRRNQHHRNHTMDVGMLGSFDIETHAIEERLHGYVR